MKSLFSPKYAIKLENPNLNCIKDFWNGFEIEFMGRFEDNESFLFSTMSSPASICVSPQKLNFISEDEKKLPIVDSRLDLNEKDQIRLRMFLRNCTSRLISSLECRINNIKFCCRSIRSNYF